MRTIKKVSLGLIISWSLLMNTPIVADMQKQAAQEVGSPWLSTRLLTPHLTVKDVEKSKQFYHSVFGFELRHENKKDNNPVHVEMSYLGELVLMFVPENVNGRNTLAPVSFSNPLQNTQYFYLYVENVDETVARAKAAGATILEAEHDSNWGDRFALIVDLDGYHWGLAQAKQFPK